MLEILEDDSVSICDKGYTSMTTDAISRRLGQLISHLCSLFPEGYKQILACFRSEDLYRTVVVESLGLKSTDDLDYIDGEGLQQIIEKALC